VSTHVRFYIVAIALGVAGCSSTSDLGVTPGTGTLYGTVSNTNGALGGVTVVVTPVGSSALPAVTTTNAGTYRIAGIDVSQSGSGTVAVSGLPSGCTVPVAASYNGLRANDSVNVSVSVTCTPSVGTIVGTITSSLGGGIAGARVTVTPSGANALAAATTGSNGAYSVSSVPTGQGTVSISSLPGTCTAPSAKPYSGLAASKTDTVNVTVTCTPATGSLSVVVSAPAGATPSVVITGPNGYTKTLSATQTISGLVVGSYTVNAATVDASNAIVGTVDTAKVSVASENVTAGATAIDSITYTARVGTGALWVANTQGSHAFVDYTASQLSSSGSPTPSMSASTAASGASANAMAFDAHGNLWTIAANSMQIMEYPAGQLTSGTPAATITINDANGVQINGIAFDGQGNLWLANYGWCDIDEISASQLAAASGSVTRTPVLILNGCASNATVTGPNGLAFDANGNLWVADIDSSDVYEYPASVLTGTGAVTSEPVFQTSPGIAAQYLAFDGGGNLWISGANQVVRLAGSQLASGGSSSPVSATPSVSVTVAAPAPSGPCAPVLTPTLEGIAFDNSGDLWAVDNANSTVVELSAAQLASGGSVHPTTTVAATNGSLGAPWSLAFNPHPTSLPQPVAPGPGLSRRRK
jgi:sugar lactone lactonase YvrE